MRLGAIFSVHRQGFSTPHQFAPTLFDSRDCITSLGFSQNKSPSSMGSLFFTLYLKARSRVKKTPQYRRFLAAGRAPPSPPNKNHLQVVFVWLAFIGARKADQQNVQWPVCPPRVAPPRSCAAQCESSLKAKRRAPILSISSMPHSTHLLPSTFMALY